MYQKSSDLRKHLIISIYIDFLRFCFPFFCIHWLMGDYILSADTARHAHDIRADTVGLLAAAQMGRCVGEMADTLSDSTFLRSHAVFRGILCPPPLRHRTVHTGREPHSHNAERGYHGGLTAELLFLRRLSDGCLDCSTQMPEPCPGPCGMDDTRRRHRLLHQEFRRGCCATGEDVGDRGHVLDDEINPNTKKIW